MLSELQARLGLTVLFVAHDLRLVRHISHRVAVMYLGRVVELAETETLFASPAHPYTQALLAAAPVLDPTHRSTHRRPSAASCRARSPSRPAARSTRAARTRSTAAGRSGRRWRHGRRTGWRATW